MHHPCLLLTLKDCLLYTLLQTSLLALLRSLPASTFTDQLDCANASPTVTLRLNASHVLRTWQHSTAADCHGIESFHPRWSQVTYQFPAALRSKSRWLVMQLRRPMSVERVSVQSWDGEWQTAGVDGSRLSAFGAASLPLEMQLDDPCRASWEVFKSHSGWIQIGSGFSQTPVSFLQLVSDVTLRFLSLNITGSEIQLLFKLTMNSYCIHCLPLSIRAADTIGFSVTSCGERIPSCVIKMINGRNLIIKVLATRPAVNGSQVTYFEFVYNETWEVPQTLLCRQGDSNELTFEKVIGIVVDSNDQELITSRLWIAGRSVTVTYLTREVFPEPQHTCTIISGSHKRNLTSALKNVSTWRNAENMTVFNISSEYKFNASMDMLGGHLICSAVVNVKSLSNANTEISYNRTINLSAPCITEVDLGSSMPWQEGEVREIRVTSHNCSIWNVTHTCWLAGAGRIKEILNISNETEFASSHQLYATKWMGQNENDWQVRCSVNQSGVQYDDVVTKKDQQPDVFYASNISLLSPSINVSHVYVEVTNLDSRPPIDKIRCLVHILLKITLNITLNRSKEGDYWFYDGPISTNISNWTNISILVNCTAQQIYNGTVVFERGRSTVTHLRPNNYIKNQSNGKNPSASSILDWRNVWLSVTSALLVILSLATVIQCVIIRRRGETRLTAGQQVQCTCGAMQMQPVNQVSPNTHQLAAPVDSCPYEYPTSHGAEIGGYTYDQPDEQQQVAGASQGLHVEDRLQPLYINYRRN